MALIFRWEEPIELNAMDATKINYDTLMHRHYGEHCRFTQNNVIDYLQLDCDPPEVSYQAMLKIPWNFLSVSGVITYEHDDYFYDDQDYRTLSREFFNEARLCIGRSEYITG